jgi:hypothetical protein
LFSSGKSSLPNWITRKIVPGLDGTPPLSKSSPDLSDHASGPKDKDGNPAYPNRTLLRTPGSLSNV